MPIFNTYGAVTEQITAMPNFKTYGATTEQFYDCNYKIRELNTI